MPTRLTANEMKHLGQELGEMLGRWQDLGRQREAGGDTEDRETFRWTGYATPYDV